MSLSPGLVLQRKHGLLIGLRTEDGQIAVINEQAGDQDALLEFLERSPLLATVDTVPSNLHPGSQRPSMTRLDAGQTEDLSVLEALLGSATASFMVAQTCNLRCHYCFAGKGDYGNRSIMGWPEAQQIVDALFEFGRDDEPVHINFFGGEPMVAWPLIQRTVLYARGLAASLERELELSMTTNATLVTAERAAFAAEHGFSVLVSIDGTQADHDRARPDVRGRGSWHAVTAGAKLLLESLGAARVAARATLRAGHASYAELERTLAEVGFKHIHLCLEGVHPSRAAADAIPSADWDRRVAHAEAVSDAYTAKDLAAGCRATGYDPLSEHIERILDGSSVSRPCGVGDTAITVDTGGIVYPCHRFVGDTRFALADPMRDGVPHDEEATKRFIELYQHVVGDCDGCPARRFCAGGCSHETLERLDNGLSPHDPAECLSIREGVLSAVAAVVHHVDHRLVSTPLLLNRRALNAEYRAAVFRRRREKTRSSGSLRSVSA